MVNVTIFEEVTDRALETIEQADMSEIDIQSTETTTRRIIASDIYFSDLRQPTWHFRLDFIESLQPRSAYLEATRVTDTTAYKQHTGPW